MIDDVRVEQGAQCREVPTAWPDLREPDEGRLIPLDDGPVGRGARRSISRRRIRWLVRSALSHATSDSDAATATITTIEIRPLALRLI
jgi:hypothetical protein